MAEGGAESLPRQGGGGGGEGESTARFPPCSGVFLEEGALQEPFVAGEGSTWKGPAVHWQVSRQVRCRAAERAPRERPGTEGACRTTVCGASEGGAVRRRKSTVCSLRIRGPLPLEHWAKIGRLPYRRLKSLGGIIYFRPRMRPPCRGLADLGLAWPVLGSQSFL